MTDKHPAKEKENTEKEHLQKIKERDSHEGPWICDRCGNWARTLENTPIKGRDKNKKYDCGCGGKFWPGR